ncbi:bifunctional 4-hydroxy-2-oxoglutarate aldolase/2-dehydro-3-deoxy-phosphogluconate aldolase [Natrarchaeobaculum aegyptiacum]|uniref:2-dehydro-3-deoxyphosphogluconate aldolase n=1 Tax=Natrarchaeobaculum aegyptiacum TaxID=745377 RepID=A0A2Z2HPV4_9EURY|nr:bifunctional 4-hydroxy-2-oxoglutarate aldolase/2-dehydro-3-deoxy-phosphogluconate aldolase [Natrarchaeobaculum aegyptiacum]ARS89106.1 2-dehydro-3-deoxyphosphogluconate aldolase [Natrarchaeobaculum aegyptiacum]
MTERRSVRDQIAECGLVAVIRGVDEADAVSATRALVDAGVTALEVTADGRHTAETVATLDREFADEDVLVGAGTVLDAETAQAVIDAGASFVISPHLEPSVVRTCNRHGVLPVPGVMTPTEAVRALEEGARVLKVFPASTLGPDHLSALQGPLGDVDLVPTGGVSSENVEAFFDAGAMAVGAGGSLVDSEAIADGDFDRVREHAETMVEAVAAARHGGNES